MEDEIFSTFDNELNVVDSASDTLKSLRNSYKDNKDNLKTAINNYEEVIKDETAQEEATENEFDDVLKYLEELKIRVHDKYQDKLLELFLPKILNASLIKDVLNV